MNDLQRWLAEKLGWVLVPGVDGRTVCIPPAGHKWAGSEMIEDDLPSPTDMNAAVEVWAQMRCIYLKITDQHVEVFIGGEDGFIAKPHDNTPASIATALCEACRAAEGAGDARSA